MWLLCFIVAHVLIRAYQQARAQAGAEWRRARNEWSAEIGRRMAAGAAGGPGESWWWWVAAADRARRSMRGPRPGAAATALPGSTPFRRIRQAAFAGAVRGAADGRRRASERRERRRQAHAAAGGSRTSRGARRAAGASGFAAGWAWGHRPRPGRPTWHRWNFSDLRDLFGHVRIGVCDNCGSVQPLTALAFQKIDTGTRIETWLLCPQCRKPAPPAPEPEPIAIDVRVNPAVGSGHPSDGPLAVEAGSGDPVPAATAGEPLSPDAPGPVPAAIEDAPYGEPAAGDNPPTNPTEITGGQMTEITAGGNRPGTELELAGNRLPAAGDAYSHGAVARAEQTDAELLDEQQVFLAAMLDDLNAVTASRAQVANVIAWAELVGTVSEMFRGVTAEMGRRYGQVIPVIDSVGRDRVAGRMSYYQEV